MLSVSASQCATQSSSNGVENLLLTLCVSSSSSSRAPSGRWTLQERRCGVLPRPSVALKMDAVDSRGPWRPSWLWALAKASRERNGSSACKKMLFFFPCELHRLPFQRRRRFFHSRPFKVSINPPTQICCAQTVLKRNSGINLTVYLQAFKSFHRIHLNTLT